MFILSVLAERQKTATKGRAAGKTYPVRVGLGVDSYNIIIARQTGNNPWMGKSFYNKLAHIQPELQRFGLDVEHSAKLIQQALSYLYKNKPNKDLTLEQLDKVFKTSAFRCNRKGKEDTSGIKQLYLDLRDFCKSDGEKDLVLKVPDPEFLPLDDFIEARDDVEIEEIESRQTV